MPGLETLSSKPIFTINKTFISWFNYEGTEEFEIEDFLEHPLGVVPLRQNNTTSGSTYSAKKLIKRNLQNFQKK